MFRLGKRNGRVEPGDQERRLLEAASARQNDLLVITQAHPIDHPYGPRIVYVNEAFERVTGYTRDEVIGNTPRILQGPKTQKPELERMRAALEKGQDVRVEVINYTKDGKEYWLEIDIAPVCDEDGRLTHFVAVQRVITDRKEAEEARRISEERFELLSRATSDLIWDWDIASGYVWWNEGLKNHFGFNPDVVHNDPEFWFQHIHPDDRERVRQEFNQILASDGNQYRNEYRFLKADGSVLVVREEAFIIRDSKGLAIRVIGSTSDVTADRKFSENAAQAQKLAALGQLTGGIAHDFNNLLTVILGNAEVLLEIGQEDEQIRSLSEVVMTAGQRAAELTDRLLSFARRQELQPTVTNVNETIEGMLPLIRRSIREDIVVSTALCDDPWMALIDPGQLEVALLNLVLNARDAIPRDGRIVIETGNTELDPGYALDHREVVPGDYVMICVSDDGKGMSYETISRAFEPFFTTKPEGRGSGLGLSMVYGFVKQSGGHIDIYSEVEKGTAIKLYFPRTEGSPGRRRVVDEELEENGKERILVVEDDHLVRHFVCSQLSSLGYEVEAAGSSDEAMRRLSEGPGFDLLFTDVVMPGGNGQGLAESARKMQPDLKILLTSGYTERYLTPREKISDRAELLSKPYSRRTLARTVRQVLDSPL